MNTEATASCSASWLATPLHSWLYSQWNLQAILWLTIQYLAVEYFIVIFVLVFAASIVLLKPIIAALVLREYNDVLNRKRISRLRK